MVLFLCAVLYTVQYVQYNSVTTVQYIEVFLDEFTFLLYSECKGGQYCTCTQVRQESNPEPLRALASHKSLVGTLSENKRAHYSAFRFIKRKKRFYVLQRKKEGLSPLLGVMFLRVRNDCLFVFGFVSSTAKSYEYVLCLCPTVSLFFNY